jgi:hypothetical protein
MPLNSHAVHLAPNSDTNNTFDEKPPDSFPNEKK